MNAGETASAPAAAPPGRRSPEPPPLPPKSRITVVAAEPDRLVLAIAPGGPKARSVGCFAVLWNVILAGIGAAFVFGFGGMGAAALFPFGILSIFAAVGVGMAVWAVRLAKTQTLLLVDRDRAAVQTILFGRKRTTTAALGPASHAKLAEVYRENDVPVHRVVIAGTDRELKFGVALSEAEKDWLVAAINKRIAAPGFAPPPAPGREQVDLERQVRERARNVPPLDPADLPIDSPVRIEESSPDRLRLSVPLLPPGLTRTFAAAVTSIVFLVAAAFAVRSLIDPGPLGNAPAWLRVAWAAPGMIFTFVSGTLAALVLRGRVTTTIGPDRVRVRWHAGLVGKRVDVPLSAIEKVTTAENVESDLPIRPALLVGRRQIVPLTTLHDARTTQEVAGLVRHQLERLGVTLREEPDDEPADSDEAGDG